MIVRRRGATCCVMVPLLPRQRLCRHPPSPRAWPSKPIRIVCGYPAGGLTDIFARAYGECISQKTGQPVSVENKTGASGAIAAEQVKTAPPDGYTLMWTISTTMIMNKVLFKKLPYDPDKDFVPDLVDGRGPSAAHRATRACRPRTSRNSPSMPATTRSASAPTAPAPTATSPSRR